MQRHTVLPILPPPIGTSPNNHAVISTVSNQVGEQSKHVQFDSGHDGIFAESITLNIIAIDIIIVVIEDTVRIGRCHDTIPFHTSGGRC
jgi:hypothetical protein